MVISFKTAAGAILSVHRQTYKIVRFRDATSGGLKVDPDATAGGKQNPALQGTRVILIYKTHMHSEATLDPERCAFNTNVTTRGKWLIKQIQHLDQHEDCISPPHVMGGDEAMEEDAYQATEQGQNELPPSGSGQHQPKTMQDYIGRAAAMPIKQIPREELGPLPTFTILIRARSGPQAVENTATELRSAYAPLAPFGSGTEGIDNERMSFSSLSGASVGSRS
jgi:hypothetical protein